MASAKLRTTLAGAGLAAGAPFALAPAAAQAIEVTNANPSGPGSLSDAAFGVNSSPTEDTITFASSLSGQTITPAAQLTFDADEVHIVGPGADRLTISGGDQHRIFLFDPDSANDPAEVRGLTLSHGNAGAAAGGAIANVDADLTVVQSVISGSRADHGGGIWFGDNVLTMVDRTTISGNTAADYGGGIYADGGLGAVINSTISGNHSSGAAGMLFNGYAFVYDSTVAGNVSSSSRPGAGVYNESLYTLYLSGSIVAGNTIAGGAISDLSGSFKAQVSLLQGTGDATVTSDGAGHNVFGLDPQLGPLAANGGSTPTRLPAPTSPAIDRGLTTELPLTDQRGVARPFDLPQIANSSASGADGTDIGAVELQAGEVPSPAAVPTPVPVTQSEPKKKCKKKRGKHKKAASSAKKKSKKKCKKPKGKRKKRK